MAEHLLDRAQVGARIQHMRRERMAQDVGAGWPAGASGQAGCVDRALEHGLVQVMPSQLARAGRLDEARLAFGKMLTYANHVGLYAEQISRAGQQQGNFPQARTHWR